MFNLTRHAFIAISAHERDVHTLFSSIAILSLEAMCILCGDAYFTALKNLLQNFDVHDDCIASITALSRMRRTYRKFRDIVRHIPARALTL